MKLRWGAGVGVVTFIAQKQSKPTFETNIDSVITWDGGLRFVDRGEGGDRYGTTIRFVGTIAEMTALGDWLNLYVYNDDPTVLHAGDNRLEFYDFASGEKPFGAYVDHSQIVYCSIMKIDGMKYRTNTTAEYEITATVRDFTKKVGVSVDFSHEVHGSRSETIFDELWSFVETQNRASNYNLSIANPKKQYSADFVFTDADVCGLVTHLTTNRGLPLGGKNISKIECVSRIGLKYWQYRIWWV